MTAGLLAVIAGIFGMHVMTANHNTHADGAAPAAVASAVGHSHAEVGHSHAEVGHSPTGHADGGHAEDADGGHAEEHPRAAGSCAGSCHDAQEFGASCTPSANTGSPTLLAPQDAGTFLRAGDGARTNRLSTYAYLPPGPTPCELSISRT
ncbi:hypothetical protein DBR22_22465 [Arthrobacter sp. HMWF013]|nr:hypothetical protein DBR22_22465 [Arthrobacter sp. HMWF013]